MREEDVQAAVARMVRRCRLGRVACQVEQLDWSAWWVVRLISPPAASWPAWRQFGVSLKVEFAAVDVVGWVVKRRVISVCINLGNASPSSHPVERSREAGRD
jgi:hypothetical protein